MMNRWRLRKIFDKSLNIRRVAFDKQRTKDFKNESNDFYIIQMSWSKLQFILSKSEAFKFATLFNFESRRERLLIVIKKTNENNNKISNEISFQYVAFQDIFSEMKAHNFLNMIFNITSSRFCRIEILFSIQFIICQRQNWKSWKITLMNIWKRTSLLNSCRLRKFSFFSSRKRMTSFVYT